MFLAATQCQYIVKYGDGSSTTGTYSTDTLALGSNAVSNFQFGCSKSESGLLLNDQTAGLIGLGGATLGFTVKTPMLRSKQLPTFYFVQLEAIRVGGKQLNIPTSVFSAGSIMDSGTIITRLPRTAYSALSSAFKAGMKQYPPAQPRARGILDTCFDFSGQSTVNIPSVTLVFSGGAVIDLAFNGIILDNCLAFAANRDDSSLGTIGNVQQQTFEVLYDVGGGVVGFKAGTYV
ncbi:aspartyl protease family protein At5g10770-like [Triticum aestivum]|nr:aspartyl protease family protein At5g10770-like [Triticum aestivum]